jgi:spermidine synthase
MSTATAAIDGVPEAGQIASMHRRALAVMLASGFAGLGYQIVWTQQCALWLGHESAALLAVVAAFFGGLALGARLLGGRIERSARPARWYAGCELMIGAWAICLALLLGPLAALLRNLIGPEASPLWHWSVAFIGTFLVLLPATAAMGATLPAMERTLSRLSAPGERIAGLYAANTAGAVIGVLASAYALVPMFGLTATAIVCAGLNLVCALIVLRSFPAASPSAPVLPKAGGCLPAVLFATGLLGIGYEVLAVRVLSQVAENTVFTFANLLAVYLVGTALGAVAYARWQTTMPSAVLRARLIQALAVAGVAGVWAMASAPALRDALLSRLGAGMGSALAVEALLAAAVFLLPTLAMGALFSHLAREARIGGLDLGRALAANTLGAALAPLVFGVWLMPALGTRSSLLLVVAGYLSLVPMARWRQWPQWGAAALLASAAALVPTLIVVDLPPGGRIVSQDEGVAASVSIVADADGVLTLHINNRQQEGSSITRYTDGRMGLLPALLQGHARTQLFLGLGTGATASIAAEDPNRQVTAVELLPGVIDAAQRFRQETGTEAAGARLQIRQADARRFVQSAVGSYDVIVADNFHPARSGSGLLYTVEHFTGIRSRLSDDGLFCQWLPLHQLDLDTLRSIVRSFLVAFPQGSAIIATNSLETPVIGLIGLPNDAGFDLGAIRAGLANSKQPDPARFGLGDELAVLGGVIAGPDALTQFAGDAPLNTDDRPVVVYRAPRATYAAATRPMDRLAELLAAVSVRPAEVIAAASSNESDRLAAYWAARNRFIALGQTVTPVADVRRMLAQVQQPLLQVLRLSPDFRPAYDPLLQMSAALASIDRPAAIDLLSELDRLQPARRDAREVLERLGEGG